MAKNDMPDIVAMGGDNNYTEVEGAGMLLDLGDQDYIKDVQEAYIDMVYDVNKDKEETIYGVPFATNASGVIYNTEKFEELGLEVPKTWDQRCRRAAAPYDLQRCMDSKCTMEFHSSRPCTGELRR